MCVCVCVCVCLLYSVIDFQLSPAHFQQVAMVTTVAEKVTVFTTVRYARSKDA